MLKSGCSRDTRSVDNLYVPGPSNRSPPATFKSTKASRGDLLEGAGNGVLCVFFVLFSGLVFLLTPNRWKKVSRFFPQKIAEGVRIGGPYR